jgi:hypothetical protein
MGTAASCQLAADKAEKVEAVKAFLAGPKILEVWNTLGEFPLWIFRRDPCADSNAAGWLAPLSSHTTSSALAD